MEQFCEYFKKDNLLSRVDARVKLFVVLVVLMMVISCKDAYFPVLVALLCLFLCLRMKIPLKALALRFVEPAVIILAVLCLKKADGLIVASRIFGAVSLVVFMGFSTPFNEFIYGLAWFRAPKGFVEVLIFAYRYIFLLFDDALVIYGSQKNRLGFSSIRRGLNSFGILSGSLVLKAIQQSQNTALAMVQRGYNGDTPFACPQHFKKIEIIAGILVICVMGILWKIR